MTHAIHAAVSASVSELKKTRWERSPLARVFLSQS
jgi:hypothetical protein